MTQALYREKLTSAQERARADHWERVADKAEYKSHQLLIALIGLSSLCVSAVFYFWLVR